MKTRPHTASSSLHGIALDAARRLHSGSIRRACALALIGVLLFSIRVLAADLPSTLLHLAGYIATDYGSAVQSGQIVSADEYQEMQEFSGQVVELTQALPESARHPVLLQQARDLQHLVSNKAAADRVAAAATRFHRTLAEEFDVRSVPRNPPSLATASSLYRQNCSSCHGIQGHGDGPAARGLDPSPTDFHDPARMSRRTVFSLYNSITQGVSGTTMAAFAGLSDDERWSLALHVANLGTRTDDLPRGERAWRDDAWQRVFAGGSAVFSLSPEELDARFGPDASAVQAYLRAHPESIPPAERARPLTFAKNTVKASRRANERGDRTLARQLAIQAYLEGFELVEAQLHSIDPALTQQTERAMMALRQQLQSDAPVDIDAQTTAVLALLDRAENALEHQQLSATASFVSALLILLREGLEALLVVAGILALLIRAQRRDALPYVHAGWIGAVALGLATWIAATYLVNISGASREFTEGVAGLLAALMLVYVGYWLHTRSAAGAWQRFIRNHVDHALARRSLWAMTALAFITVYREMFETVLFYQALWIEAGPGARHAVAAGFGAGVLILAGIAYALLQYGLKLPLRPFFVTTAWLLCALAVVMAGEGIRSLQEADTVATTPIAFPTLAWLGVFPTLQGVLTQLATAGLIVVGLLLARQRTNAALSH